MSEDNETLDRRSVLKAIGAPAAVGTGLAEPLGGGDRVIVTDSGVTP